MLRKGGGVISMKKVKSEEIKITVTKSYLGTSKEQRGTIEIRPFATEPAYLTVKKGVTLPVGEYQFARIDVSLSFPCYREEVNEVYKLANAWVEKKLDEETKVVDVLGGD